LGLDSRRAVRPRSSFRSRLVWALAVATLAIMLLMPTVPFSHLAGWMAAGEPAFFGEIKEQPVDLAQAGVGAEQVDPVNRRYRHRFHRIEVAREQRHRSGLGPGRVGGAEQVRSRALRIEVPQQGASPGQAR